ncbi:MAG: viperin family antiviral radical SAM protein [Succinivibrionaceae bacterium]|nr:viperin family antiviral radical SAM protein [Succinivibrionaceae bacterium]
MNGYDRQTGNACDMNANAGSDVLTAVAATAGLAGLIKFNLHILERCNYACRYCFAKFGCRKVLGLDVWKKIVLNCHRYAPDCCFNIAGGEPLMVSWLGDLIRFCRELGHRVSVITNGALATEKWIRDNVPLLDTFGISLDSFDENTLKAIGRNTRSGRFLDGKQVAGIMEKVERANPACGIKVNTVVCSLNCHELMSGDIRSLPVSRWKIFKMLPFDNGCFSNADLAVTDEAYGRYIERNLGMSWTGENGNSISVSLGERCRAVVESNLRGGYLMIDAKGHLVDDTRNTSYTSVVDCVNEELSDGIGRLGFDPELYRSRYVA